MNLQKVKQQLLAARAVLEARVERTHKHTHGREEAVSPNFHEQVVETGNDEVVQLLEQEARLELQQIRRALERLDSGNYLHCAKCHAAIGEQRLRALPWTEFCIACA